MRTAKRLAKLAEFDEEDVRRLLAISRSTAIVAGVSTAPVVKAWAPAADVRDLFGIPRSALNRLVEQGDVRRKKMPGDATQAGATYCLADVVQWLEGSVECAGAGVIA